MSLKQQTINGREWTASTIDLGRVLVKFPLEVETELKNYIQSLGTIGEIESTPISRSDFPLLDKALDPVREEVEYGQRFVILDSVGGLAYNEIQLFFWIIGHVLGNPIIQNEAGQRLIHVYDRDKTKQIKDGARYHQTHESGAVHTDNVNTTEHWEYLMVGCVAPAMIGGENIIANGFAAHAFLEKKAPQELAVLRENFWWEYRGISKELYQAPIITYNKEGEPLFRHLRTYMESAHRKADQPLTEQQVQALDAFDATLNMSEFQIRHRLKAGQILVTYDSQIFHDRECFVDFPDSISVDDKQAGKNGILRRTLERGWIRK
jgi:alpha-ketoglutarate-dependent taurine dioxygenase